MQPPVGIQLFPLFAHQGGWDEILMVVGPLLVIGALLFLANRRVNAQLERAHQDGGSTGASQRQ